MASNNYYENERAISMNESEKTSGDNGPDKFSKAIKNVSTNESKRTSGYLYVLVFFGCLTGIMASQLMLEFLRNRSEQNPQVPLPNGTTTLTPQPPPDAVTPGTIKNRSQAERMELAKWVAEPLLAWAKTKCDEGVVNNIKIVDNIFTAAKDGTGKFTDNMLGYYSKWLVVRSYIPFTKDYHKEYLKIEFENRIISSVKLENAIKLSIELQLKEIQNIENMLLVKLKTDTAGIPGLRDITLPEKQDLKDLFDKAVHKQLATDASNAIGDATIGDIGIMASSWIASGAAAPILAKIIAPIMAKISASIAAKMAASGAISAVAAPSAPVTFGLSFVVGIVLDQMISWVWDWYADPKGDLVKKLNNTIEELRQAVVEGADGPLDANGLPGPRQPGLKEILNQINNARDRSRRSAIINILSQ